MRALVLDIDSAPIGKSLLDRGLLVNACDKTALRFLPPFVLTDDELAQGLHLLDEALTEAQSSPDPAS